MKISSSQYNQHYYSGEQESQEDEIDLLAAAVHSAHDSIVITTSQLEYPGPEIIFVNQAFTKMTGYQADEIIGQTPRILQGEKTDLSIFQDLKSKLRRGEIFFAQAINYRKDGTEFYNQWHIEPIVNSKGITTHYLAIQRDITEQKKAEQQLIYDACHDSLTGFYNRSWFLNHLQECLNKSQKNKNYLFALLFLDLDGFKWINDTLGHSVGDRFLQEVSAKIKESMRTQDVIARWGGDEFTIIIKDIQDISIISKIIEHIQNNLRKSSFLNTQDVSASVSIGVTLNNIGYHSGEEMLRDADLAMYQAKSTGISESVVFHKNMRQVVINKLSLQYDLRKALAKEEFQLYYQPIVNLDGEIVGFEALLRWDHGNKGIISPAQFIPVAEETGLIIEIGQWVLSQACLMSSRWQNLFPDKNLFININLSPRQFKQSDLVAQIESTVQKTQCDRNSIKLEITESALLETENKAKQMLHNLADLGIKLCLDDFGTGYSSLSRLYTFPIDTLKIDACFIRAIGKKVKKEKILHSIINLAHNIEMNVVAEGVETQQQFAKIREYQCEYAQGYFFGKPAPAQDVEKLI